MDEAEFLTSFWGKAGEPVPQVALLGHESGCEEVGGEDTKSPPERQRC